MIMHINLASDCNWYWYKYLPNKSNIWKIHKIRQPVSLPVKLSRLFVMDWLGSASFGSLRLNLWKVEKLMSVSVSLVVVSYMQIKSITAESAAGFSLHQHPSLQFSCFSNGRLLIGGLMNDRLQPACSQPSSCLNEAFFYWIFMILII